MGSTQNPNTVDNLITTLETILLYGLTPETINLIFSHLEAYDLQRQLNRGVDALQALSTPFAG